MYRFSKSGRLFVQGTREEDDRDNVAASNPSGTDLQAIYTKRRLSTEVLGEKIKIEVKYPNDFYFELQS